MKQILIMALHNVKNSGARGVLIVLLMTGTLYLAIASNAFAIAIGNMVETKNEELDSKLKMTVYSGDGSVLALNMLDVMETIDGVSAVVGQYNIKGLLEESEGNPIYQVSMNGFDFEQEVFIGADDFTGTKASGIILPDISYEFNGMKVLKDYVGEEVLFSYDYVLDGQYTTRTITCKVLGVYEATGGFETNPVFMSLDLFSEILADYSEYISGVQRAIVYVEDAEKLKVVAEQLTEYGLDVSYETTLEEYKNTLQEIVKIGYLATGIVLILSVIIISQSLVASLRRRIPIIGIMKTYGYSLELIGILVVAEVVVYVAISMLMAISLSYVTEEKILQLFSMMFGSINFDITGKTLIPCVIIGLCVIIAASMFPLVKTAKVNVVDILGKSE